MGGEWVVAKVGSAAAEDRQLELTLGLPGGERRSWAPAPVASWDAVNTHNNDTEDDDGSGSSGGLSLGLFTKCPKSSNISSAGVKSGYADCTEETNPCGYENMAKPQQHKEVEDTTPQWQLGGGHSADAKAPSAATASPAVADKVAAHNRTPAAPVVGWPPIRSFRKNMATSSRLAHPSKASSATDQCADQQLQKPPSDGHSNCSKGVFVKINMDGIPIGRKVDLKSCQGYDTLSAAVDKLFRGLLMAAQKAPDPAAASAPNSDGAEGRPMITGLLDGTGEYTLVYEDEEGDRILVGDVPWEMFITTAKRLRVLRTSELSKLSLGATSRKRAAPEPAGVC